MDTTSFDKQMEEYRKQAVVGVPFPPPARNAAISKAKEVDNLLVTTPVHNNEVLELKSQIKALLEDNEKLADQVAGLEGKLQRVARLTDNEKLILWIRKYDLLKAECDEIKFRMDGLVY